MNQESNLIFFDEAYDWLNKYSESFLSEPVDTLVQCMEKALDVGDHPKVHYYIGVTRQVGQSLSGVGKSYERAETHLECAKAYYRLRDFRSSITEFRQALSLFGGSAEQDIEHKIAITHWLLGWAFWQISKQSDAIVHWELSYQIFQRLSLVEYKDSQGKMQEWYVKQS